MTEQIVVSITIEESHQHNQENTSLKIQLDEDTSIKQLIEYLCDEEKIVVAIDMVEVICGQNVISSNSIIKDAISSGNKIELLIRVKNQKNLLPPPAPQPKPILVQNQKNPMNISSIENSNFDIPATSTLQQSKLQQKIQQQKRLQEEKQKAHFITAQQVAQQKAPKPTQQIVTLVIELIDGNNEVTIDFQAAITQCWDDLKARLFEYIAAKSLVDNWSKQQQIKLQCNGHVYKKVKIPFKTLNLAANGKIKFQMTRIFPGGCQ